MNAITAKQVRHQRRKMHIRKHVLGSSERPRLTVYRSLKHVYAQVIDDLTGKTMAAASTQSLHLKQGGNATAAKDVGKAIAEKAKAAGITAVVFDRNGFKYHGRVKSLADAARAAGLKF